MDNAPSPAFQTFLQEAAPHAHAWFGAVQGLEQACALDGKTQALAYLAVLSVLGLESGVSFHVGLAKEAGASREEVISAVLLGLPAAGNRVVSALPIALKAFDGV